LTPSEESRLLGESPRDAADEVAGLVSFTTRSRLFDIVSTPSEASRLNVETPLGATEEDTVPESFSVNLILSEVALLASDATLRRGDIPRSVAYEVDGLSSPSARPVPFDTVPTPSEAN